MSVGFGVDHKDATHRTPMPYTSDAALTHLYLARAATCTRCSLRHGRQKVVCGTGNSKADVLIVGQAPSEASERAGTPFTGNEDQVLTSLLGRAGISRETTYTTTAVKCKTPNGRLPTSIECGACSPFLHTQIAIIQPKVILALGIPASLMVTAAEEDTTMADLRAKTWFYSSHVTEVRIPVVVTHPPSWFVSQMNTPHIKQAAETMISDMKKLLDFIPQATA